MEEATFHSFCDGTGALFVKASSWEHSHERQVFREKDWDQGGTEILHALLTMGESQSTLSMWGSEMFWLHLFLMIKLTLSLTWAFQIQVTSEHFIYLNLSCLAGHTLGNPARRLQFTDEEST